MNSKIRNETPPSNDLLLQTIANWQNGFQEEPDLPPGSSKIHPEPEKIRLLKERAHALAPPAEDTDIVEVQLDIIEFRLGTELYAFASSSVREVYSFKGLTPLPHTPAFVLGVINVRGRILPVIDIAPLFGSSPQGVKSHGKAIIVRTEELEAGIFTETVIGVRQLPLSALYPPLSTLTTARSRYFRGVTSEGLIVLDALKLLTGIRLGDSQ
jgi:purine-binding chemotaxis protein CheW